MNSVPCYLELNFEVAKLAQKKLEIMFHEVGLIQRINQSAFRRFPK